MSGDPLAQSSSPPQHTDLPTGELTPKHESSSWAPEPWQATSGDCAESLESSVYPSSGAKVVSTSTAVTKDSYDDSLAIDPSVTLVKTGGYWSFAQVTGVYRVLVRQRCTPMHCKDELFLQWLEVRGQRLILRASVEIKEAGLGFVVQNIDWMPWGIQAGTIALQLRHSPSLGHSRLLIRPLAFGQYRVADRATG